MEKFGQMNIVSVVHVKHSGEKNIQQYPTTSFIQISICRSVDLELLWTGRPEDPKLEVSL